QVKKTGISELTLGKILDSRKEGQKIKLVASIEWVNDVLHAEVAPRIVTEGDPLYFIDHENNAIVVEGSLSGAQTYIGKGAGSLPTGSAVLNDLNLLMHGFQYPHVTRRNVA
ncbi:MAG: hypothetical protein OEY56_02430, partial [Cyclobacteriaceae bacterium]|nr:hypothetical protein [Cyclobacteriaceae bacterium]